MILNATAWAFIGAGMMAVAQILWEFLLHRRTISKTKVETDALMARVEDVITKAQTDRDAIRGDVDAARADVKTIPDELREDLEQLRAEMRAQLAATNAGVKAMADAFAAAAAAPEPEPEPPAQFAHGRVDPREAQALQAEKLDELAAAEMGIREMLVKNLGSEELGEMAFDWARANKGPWKRAIKAMAEGRVDTVKKILGPSAARYAVQDKKTTTTSSSGPPF